MDALPDKTILLGYSGGMALLISNWEEYELFYEVTKFYNNN